MRTRACRSLVLLAIPLVCASRASAQVDVLTQHNDNARSRANLRETRGRRQETGGRRQEAGDRRQETGGRKQEAGFGARGPGVSVAAPEAPTPSF